MFTVAAYFLWLIKNTQTRLLEHSPSEAIVYETIDNQYRNQFLEFLWIQKSLKIILQWNYLILTQNFVNYFSSCV